MSQLVLRDIQTVLEGSPTALVAAQIASGVARDRDWPVNSVAPAAVHRHIVELLRIGHAVLVPHSIAEDYEGYPSHYRAGECFFLGARHLRPEHAQTVKGPTTRYWRKHRDEMGEEVQFAAKDTDELDEARAETDPQPEPEVVVEAEPVEPVTPAATLRSIQTAAIPHITEVLTRADALRQLPLTVRKPLRLALLTGGASAGPAITPIFSAAENTADAAPQQDIRELIEFFCAQWQERARSETGVLADAIKNMSQKREGGQSPYSDEEIERLARVGALVCELAEQQRDLVEQILGSVQEPRPQRSAIN